MSVGWEGHALLQPITADRPCGDNLDDTPLLLASFDAFRLYGRTKPFEPSSDSAEARKTLTDRDERPPEWEDVKNRSLAALQNSKDLRLLVHLGTALLRTDGLSAFVETVNIASRWLNDYWGEIYPLIDGDGILRRSALNCFADPIAVVDALRRTPIVRSRQHGTFNLRDVDIASGQAPPAAGEVPKDVSQINAAFSTIPIDELTSLEEGVASALASLKSIDQKMRAELGTEAAPGFDPLSAQLTKIDRVLRTQIALRPGAAPLEGSGSDGAVDARTTVAVGVIRSRDDAIRSLDAIAEFFRKNEPSSPVPLFCDRAKRLISRSFLEVLADVAPDALGAARAAGGLKAE